MSRLRDGRSARRAGLLAFFGRKARALEDDSGTRLPFEPRRQRLQREVRRAQRRQTLRRTSALGIVLVLATMGVVSGIMPSSAAGSLILSTTEGAPGDEVTASGDGLDPCGTFFLFFTQDNQSTFLQQVQGNGGSFEDFDPVVLTVPADANPGAATFDVSCNNSNDGSAASTSFTVIDPTPPTLEVNPASGRPGDTVAATATNHDCTDVFFFIDGIAAGQGTEGVAASVTVPSTDPGVTLLSSSCSADDPGGLTSVNFTVLDTTEPILTLDPDAGVLGSTYDIVGFGHLNECGDSSNDIHVFVDGSPLDVVQPSVDTDEFTIQDVTVPAGATADFDVTTHCFKDGSDGPVASATFDVLLPELTLFPDEGEAGELFTAIGENHPACSAGTVQVSFGTTTLGTPTNEELANGAEFTVPDVAPGQYTVATRCPAIILFSETSQQFVNPNLVLDDNIDAVDTSVIASATFTVLPPPPPSLFADPTFGQAGAKVTLTGADHDTCANITLKFDSTVVGTATATAGSFSKQVTVPADATKGAHTFSSACSANSPALATTPFQVVGLIPTLVATPIGTGGVSPPVMAQTLAGEGVTVSNVKYTGAPQASGTFRTDFVADEPSSFVVAAAVPDLIGFPEGIILSSGGATNITGRNNDDGITGGLGLPGDAALDQLSKVTTNDASILEFDFVPAEDKVAFQYVFASDEYNEFVNSSFNDVFAFFVNGKNCAVVPGTNTPVSINTINNGNPLGSGTITNPQLYRNNDPDDPNPTAPTIEPDGFTTVLKCQATVTPNQKNTMRLAIADGSDSSLDSWVFLAADSLISVPPTNNTTPPTDNTTPPTLIPPVIITIPPDTTPPGTVPPGTTPPFNGPFVVTTLDDGEAEIEETAAPGTTTPVTVLGSQEDREPPQRGEQRGAFEDRSKFTDSLFRPDDISGDLGLLAQNAGLSILLVLLIMFPAELFNKTYEENQSTIRGWFAGLRRFGRKAKAALEPVMGEQQVRNTFIRTPLVLLGFAGVMAVLYGALDPTLGLNKGSAALMVGFLLAILLVTITYELTAARFIKRKLGIRGEMRAFPGAMVVAIACIAVSRAVDFAPGYLFGIIAGFQFHGDVSEEDEGKAIAFGALNMLILGLVAWFLWAPVDSLVNRSDPHFMLLALDAVLAATFVAAIEGLIFGLLPLRFLDGEKVLRYSQLVWVTLFGLGIFTFVHVLLHPRTGYVPTSEAVSVFTVVLMFAAFGLFSFSFWGYFKLREEPADDEEEDEPIYLT